MSLHSRDWLGILAAAAAAGATGGFGLLGAGAGAGLGAEAIGEVAPTVAADTGMLAAPQIGTGLLSGADTIGSVAPAATDAMAAAPQFGGLAGISDYMYPTASPMGETAMLQPPQMGRDMTMGERFDKLGKGAKFAQIANGQPPQQQAMPAQRPQVDPQQATRDEQIRQMAMHTGQDPEMIKRRLAGYSGLFGQNGWFA